MRSKNFTTKGLRIIVFKTKLNYSDISSNVKLLHVKNC